MTSQELAERASHFFDSRRWSRFRDAVVAVSFVVMILVTWQTWGLNKSQVRLNRCVAAIADQTSDTTKARAQLADEERQLNLADRKAQLAWAKAQQAFLLNPRSPSLYTAYIAATATYLTTQTLNEQARTKLDKERGEHPIPQGPAEQCKH